MTWSEAPQVAVRTSDGRRAENLPSPHYLDVVQVATLRRPSLGGAREIPHTPAVAPRAGHVLLQRFGGGPVVVETRKERVKLPGLSKSLSDDEHSIKPPTVDGAVCTHHRVDPREVFGGDVTERA